MYMTNILQLTSNTVHLTLSHIVAGNSAALHYRF